MNPQTLSGCNVIWLLKPSSPDPWFWLCCGVLLVHVSHKLSCWWNARLVELKYFSADWHRCACIRVHHFRPEQSNQAFLQKLSQVSQNRICSVSEVVITVCNVPDLYGEYEHNNRKPEQKGWESGTILDSKRFSKRKVVGTIFRLLVQCTMCQTMDTRPLSTELQMKQTWQLS